MLGQPCTVPCTIRRLDETRQHGTNSALSGPILSVDRVAPSPTLDLLSSVAGQRGSPHRSGSGGRAQRGGDNGGLRGVTPLIRAKSSALSWRSLLERSAFVEHGVDGSGGSVTAPDPRDDARRRSARSAWVLFRSPARRTMVVGAVRNRALFGLAGPSGRAATRATGRRGIQTRPDGVSSAAPRRPYADRRVNLNARLTVPSRRKRRTIM